MNYWPLLLLSVLLGAVLLLVAVRLLLSRSWVGGFLRGLCGLFCIAILVLMVILSFDLAAYRALSRETVVATLSFNQLDSQRYKAQLATVSGNGSYTFGLNGDEWQVDARILTWQGPLAVLGMEPVYRLERISGRYLRLDQERKAQRTVYGIDQGKWISMSNLEPWLPWVDARFGSAAYLPMVDGGIFEVGLTGKGIVARPVNGPAREAVKDWASE